MSPARRAPGLVGLAALWGATDVAYSIYVLASEPAGLLLAMDSWLPHARQAVIVSAILGVFIGGAFFVGAFMTHHGVRPGLLVLLSGVVLYTVSGLSYAAWGLVTHDEVSSTIYLANPMRGNEINKAIWSYFVGIACISVVIGGAFAVAIRRAWRRFSQAPDANTEPSAPSGPAFPALDPTASMSVEIERLNDLRVRGLLTEEEYRHAKAKLLA